MSSPLNPRDKGFLAVITTIVPWDHVIMPAKRTRNATTDDAAPSWKEQAKAAIKTGDIAKVQHIMNELQILTTFGQSRLPRFCHCANWYRRCARE